MSESVPASKADGVDGLADGVGRCGGDMSCRPAPTRIGILRIENMQTDHHPFNCFFQNVFSPHLVPLKKIKILSLSNAWLNYYSPVMIAIL